MGARASQPYEIKERIDGKTVIVTGCNTGIGKPTAQEFYRVGGRVIMACRDVSKAEKAADEIRKEVELSFPHDKAGKLIIKKLDLSSLESIRNFVDDLNDSEDQINILVNNAGVMSPTRKTTADGFELTFGTNYLGHFYLTLLLLPRILASAPARIVNVSSLAYEYGRIHWDNLSLERNYGMFTAYSQSKLANILFTRELASRLDGMGVTVNSLCPGVSATDITRFYGGVIRKIWGYLCPLVQKTIPEAITTILFCALDKSLDADSGFYYSDCARKELAPHALSEEDAKKLWDLSLTLVGLEEFPVKDNKADGLRIVAA
ncbi:retinol dehydrogenase 14 isoform X2 [Bemisia tabaci]|uniref:retinol dehydrogenase 14 isoform X2 n=1 Tax=Bemisia tabaci TaxID=7038 RepID=UPI003B28A4AA